MLMLHCFGSKNSDCTKISQQQFSPSDLQQRQSFSKLAGFFNVKKQW